MNKSTWDEHLLRRQDSMGNARRWQEEVKKKREEAEEEIYQRYVDKEMQRMRQQNVRSDEELSSIESQLRSKKKRRP